MKKYTVVGTDIEEVKRLNALSQRGGDPASGLPMQGSMDLSQFEEEFASEIDFQENELKQQNDQSENAD